jgi:hypothetical protein
VRAPRALPSSAPPAGRLLTRLLDAPVLDRLIRGRTWIALIGFALLGIVAMQVTILSLGASIGRSVAQIEQITERNESLETTIAGLEPGRDVASEAAALGMVYPPADNIGYLTFHAGDAALAAANLTRPTVPLLAPESPSLTDPLTATTSAAVTTDPLTTTSASTTDASTTDASTTDASTTDASTTDASTTDPSTIAAPTPTTSGGADLAPASSPAAGVVTAAGGSSAPDSGASG